MQLRNHVTDLVVVILQQPLTLACPVESAPMQKMSAKQLSLHSQALRQQQDTLLSCVSQCECYHGNGYWFHEGGGFEVMLMTNGGGGMMLPD